jgi:hypothetical protein
LAALTNRLPREKLDRLRDMAKARSVSVNKLIDGLATVALANHDAHARYEVRSARGHSRVALEQLSRLDQGDLGRQMGAGGAVVHMRNLTQQRSNARPRSGFETGNFTAALDCWRGWMGGMVEVDLVG